MSPEPSLTILKPSLTNSLSQTDIDQCNAKVDRILETARRAQSSWQGREQMPEPIRELLDVYVDITGQKPTKGKLMDWLATGQEWMELGAITEDIRQAYSKANPGNGKDGFLVSRPGSLTNTIGMFAGRRKMHPIHEAADPMAPFKEYMERQNDKR